MIYVYSAFPQKCGPPYSGSTRCSASAPCQPIQICRCFRNARPPPTTVVVVTDTEFCQAEHSAEAIGRGADTSKSLAVNTLLPNFTHFDTLDAARDASIDPENSPASAWTEAGLQIRVCTLE